MEVGAVKQSFNNELILLKKKMNQAKIQIIHKLTRKAKTFSQKKAPDHLKDKLSRKMESAVKEVLIIKKIVPKELARFAVTHKGSLNDFLNKPNVDHDKACARLLLHKCLQDKYKLLRRRFSSIPIEELLMSREERRKRKKEEREKRKQKIKDKNNVKKNTKVVNAEGEWDVEEIEIPNKLEFNDSCNESDMETEQCKTKIESGDDGNQSDVEENLSFKEEEGENEEESDVDSLHNPVSEFNQNDSITECKQSEKIINSGINNFNDKKSKDTSKFEMLKTHINEHNNVRAKENGSLNNKMVLKQDTRRANEKKVKSKHDKNKNLNEKLQTRKFKKDINEDVPVQVQTKIIDTFFITSTGDNYLSVVEPRAPDEIKDVHKQGNRKLRRAAMFGHTPKIKPKQNFESNSRFGGQHKVDGQGNTKAFKNNRNEFDSDSRNTINKRNQFNVEEPVNTKPEKLHPSWEAKKRQSGILPFQGKKIVFDES